MFFCFCPFFLPSVLGTFRLLRPGCGVSVALFPHWRPVLSAYCLAWVPSSRPRGCVLFHSSLSFAHTTHFCVALLIPKLFRLFSSRRWDFGLTPTLFVPSGSPLPKSAGAGLHPLLCALAAALGLVCIVLTAVLVALSSRCKSPTLRGLNTTASRNEDGVCPPSSRCPNV